MRPALRDHLHLFFSRSHGLARTLIPKNMLSWRRQNRLHPSAKSDSDLPATAASPSTPTTTDPSISRVSSAPDQSRQTPATAAGTVAPTATTGTNTGTSTESTAATADRHAKTTTKTTTTTPRGQPEERTANGASKAPGKAPMIKAPTPPLQKLIHKARAWTPKASPSTSVVCENISGGTVKPKGSPELRRFGHLNKNDDTSRPATSVTRDPLALPKAAGAALTGVGVSVVKMGKKKIVSQNEEEEQAGDPRGPPSKPAEHTRSEAPLTPPKSDDPVNEAREEPATQQQAPQQQAAASGWMYWWSRSAPIIPPEPAVTPDPASDSTPTHHHPPEEVRQGANQERDQLVETTKPHDEATATASNKKDGEPPCEGTQPAPTPAAGWYGYLPSMNMLPSVPVPGFLSYAYPLRGSEQAPSEGQEVPAGADSATESAAVGDTSPAKTEPASKPASAKDVEASKSQTAPEGAAAAAAAAKDAAPAGQAEKKTGPLPRAGSTWAFWYRDAPAGPKGKAAEAEPGEIAVMGEGSEAQPTPVAESDVVAPAQDSKSSEPEVKEASTSTLSLWQRTKKARPLSLDIDALLSSSKDGIKPITRSSTSDQGAAAVPAPAAEHASTPTRTEFGPKPAAAVSETTAKSKPNLLLPSFASTYQMKENPSILRQITSLVVGSPHAPPNHVYRVKSAPKIRKAIVVGVHGFFPASYLRPMIGQPTGTSLRFANLAAEAVRRWADGHGSPGCEIEKVALEGEGRINERVDNLWKLLLNWVDQIRQADLIIMACHSQGVPVGVMLLQKLIDLGIVTRARIGVCAMAGVSLGPFPDLKSSIFTGSAAELWEFGNPSSNNSRRFELSLKRILDYGARITFIGSIDDQLVPMESAVYSPANHPYIYRAVFIDGRIHAPDFIAHLVGFALKLRNLGVSDHGLIRELSVPLAGSLYSGEGHSRLYYDDAVYDLAIMHALETSNTANPTPCSMPSRRDTPTTTTTTTTTTTKTKSPNTTNTPSTTSNTAAVATTSASSSSTAAAAAANTTTTTTTTPLTSSNPYILPWIMRGLLEEAYVKTELGAETEELLRQFDDWKPTNKALKDVKYRLEAVRSKL